MRALWHGYRWLRQPYQYFHQEAVRKGPTWRAPLPGLGNVLVSGEPQLLKEVMSHPDLSGGKAHRALRATLGEDHLIVLWGEAHRQRRRALLHAMSILPESDMIAEVTRQELSAQPLYKPFSFHRVGHRASLRIMLRWLLGTPLKQEQALLAAALRFQESFSNPLLLYLPWLRQDWGPRSPWGRLLRRRRHLEQLLQDALGNSASMASRLQEHVSDSGLTNELLAMLMFGHETTAATLSWCLAHSFVYSQAGGPLHDNDPNYSLAFVQESLRVSPAVGQLTRVAECDLEVGGWSVAQGEVIMPAIPLAHESLGPRSNFVPKRFLSRTLPLHQYCPFGFGDRLCPGRSAALRQLTTMLETVVREFRLVPCAPPAKPVRKLFLVLPQGDVSVVRL